MKRSRSFALGTVLVLVLLLALPFVVKSAYHLRLL